MARAETGRGARRKDRLASIEFTKLQARQGRFRFPDTQLDRRFQRFKVVDDKSQFVFAELEIGREFKKVQCIDQFFCLPSVRGGRYEIFKDSILLIDHTAFSIVQTQ